MGHQMQQGEIYLVNFPNEDNDKYAKLRPTVVIYIGSKENSNFYGLKITTTERADDKYSCKLTDWKGAGLLKPSSIRCDKIQRFNKSEMIRTPVTSGCIGRLSERDQCSVKRHLNYFLDDMQRLALTYSPPTNGIIYPNNGRGR